MTHSNISHSDKEFEEFLEGCLNLALQSSLNGETSLHNSFSIKMTKKGIYFIPRLPAVYSLNKDLYDKIYTVLATSAYPFLTVIPQPNINIVPLESESLSSARALFFPIREGIPERLVIPDIEKFAEQHSNGIIPLMPNYSIDYNKIHHMLISGTTGSGKSYHLQYLLYALNKCSTLLLIDPKLAEVARFAREHNLQCITPSKDRSKTDMVGEINKALAKALETIVRRQEQLLENPNLQFKPITIVIEEVGYLVESIPKTVRDSFQSLLTEISLLGRASKVSLVLVAQQFNANVVPTSLRQQASVIIQVGHLNKDTLKFLFPDYSTTDNILSIQSSEIGSGIIQVIGKDSNHIFPLLTPTYFIRKDTSK